MHGEFSGQPKAEGAFWAKVIRAVGDYDDYEVEDAKGEKHTIPRSELRHRVLHREAFVGTTGDRKHDTYSMRHFSELELDALCSREGALKRGDGSTRNVFDEEDIRVISTHSDNAAQVPPSAPLLHLCVSPSPP